jgi:hypothetical protein
MSRIALLVAALALPLGLLGCEATPIGPDSTGPSLSRERVTPEPPFPAPPADPPLEFCGKIVSGMVLPFPFCPEEG